MNIDQSIKQEIANALSEGKEVIVHETNLNFSGFTGVGYIILDPETGAAAYKVSGGANGAITVALVALALGALALLLVLFASPLMGVAILFAYQAAVAAYAAVMKVPLNDLVAAWVNFIGRYVLLFIFAGSLGSLIAFGVAGLLLIALMYLHFLIPDLFSWKRTQQRRTAMV